MTSSAAGAEQVSERASAGYDDGRSHTGDVGVAHSALAPAVEDLCAGWWDVSDDDYHASDLVSRGKLYTLLREGSDYYRAQYEQRIIATDVTKAMRRGSLVHCAVLEPERWERSYCPPPPPDLGPPEPPKPIPAEGSSPNAKPHRENLARWRDELAAWSDRHAAALREYTRGREIVSRDDWDAVLGMADAIAMHPRASALLSGAGVITERAMRWQDATTGLWLRAKPDAYDDTPVMADLKSIGMAPTPANVARVIASSWYHGQAAIYSDGYEAVEGQRLRAFVVPFVRSTPPYTVAVVELAPMAVELGRREYRAALRELAERTASQEWTPEWAQGAWQIDLPGWAYQQSTAWMESNTDG